MSAKQLEHKAKSFMSLISLMGGDVANLASRCLFVEGGSTHGPARCIAA